MPLKDKLKNVFHHKKTASKDLPKPEIVGSKVAPMSKDPGFRKSFNLGENGEESGESSSSRPISAAGGTDSLMVPGPNRHSHHQQAGADGGSGAMYTVDPYEGEYMSVSPRTKSTIPDSSTIGSGDDVMTTVPSLDLRKSGGLGVDTMEPIGEGQVLEGATQKLEAMTSQEGGLGAAKQMYPEEKTEREGGTLEPFPTRSSESGAAYGTGAYTAPQRLLQPVSSNDATSSIYSEDMGGARPGLGPPRDTDASVYSQDMVSGQRTPKVNEEVAKDSGVPGHVEPKTAPTDVLLSDEAVTESKVQSLSSSSTAPLTKEAETAPAVNGHQTAYTSLLKDVMADTHTPQSQTERLNQPTRFHQPGDFFSAVQNTFPESAAAENREGFQTTGYGVTPSGMKGDDAAAWSKGVISGIDGVDVQTPREEKTQRSGTTGNTNLVSGILDQASEEAVRQDGPVGNQSTAHPYFAKKEIGTTSAQAGGITAAVSTAVSNAYTSVADTVSGSTQGQGSKSFASYTRGFQSGSDNNAGIGAAVANTASNAYSTVANTLTGQTAEKPAESSFTQVPEVTTTSSPGVATFGDPSEITTTSSREQAAGHVYQSSSAASTYTPPENTSVSEATTVPGVLPTVTNAVSNAYSSASEALTGSGSTNTQGGIVPTISNAVSSAYNSATQTLSEATISSPTSVSHIPSERDIDLEKGHGSRDVAEGTGATSGISNVISNISDNIAKAVAPSAETKQWASGLVNDATGNTTEDKQADAAAGILGSQNSEHATKLGEVDPMDKLIGEATHPIITTTNTVPHAQISEQDVPDIAHEYETRPKEVPFGGQPIMTTSNALNAADFNQATPATAYGQNETVRDTEGSQADKAFVENEFDKSRAVRPGIESRDTTATIDVVKGMPGGMW